MRGKGWLFKGKERENRRRRGDGDVGNLSSWQVMDFVGEWIQH